MPASATDDATWKTISTLKFDDVRERLMHRKGWWWSLRHDVGKIEREYRQFLYLIATNRGRTVVPWSQDLDDFWHEHILDTARYAADCEHIFGGFIHHDPHLPMGSRAHSDAFRATIEMYRQAFGEKIRKRRKEGPGCGTDMHVVFCSSGTVHGAGNHHGGGHHAGGHDGGHSGGHDGGHGGGHGCGGHGGGHGCGGHGCGGAGH
jgi:hypothetical protein